MPHMDTQLDMDTINAVPTPRLLVGDNVFAAQLLMSEQSGQSQMSR
jgi:hypothetical protein